MGPAFGALTAREVAVESELEQRLQRTFGRQLARHMDQDIEACGGRWQRFNLGLSSRRVIDRTPLLLGDLIPISRSGQKGIQAEETRHILGDAINRLPDRERLVITLIFEADPGQIETSSGYWSRVCNPSKSVMSLRNRLSCTTIVYDTRRQSPVGPAPKSSCLPLCWSWPGEEAGDLSGNL